MRDQALCPFFLPTLLAALSVGCDGGAQPQARPLGETIVAPATAQELEGTPWLMLPGRPEGLPAEPLLMMSAVDRVITVDGTRISEYDPNSNIWRTKAESLPAALGEGAAATIDYQDHIYVMRGGRTSDFWHIDTDTFVVEALPPTPEPVGRGGSIAYDRSNHILYALRGDATGDCWRYSIIDRAWEHVEPIEKKIKAIGNPCGAIMQKGRHIFAWPDHHIKQYTTTDGATQNLWSYGFRPWKDSLFAHDRSGRRWFITAGKGSRTLSLFDPKGEHWAYVRPLLPRAMTGQNGRSVVAMADGEKVLLIYDGHEDNTIFRVPLSKIELLRTDTPVSDIGSPWTTRHERWGSSTVRFDTGGLMGRVRDHCYFVRFKGARFFDLTANEWARYPGVPAVYRLPPGLAATWGGGRFLYIFSGGGKNFVRVDYERFIAEEADAVETETLPEPNADALVGAQLAPWNGKLHAIMGGETRLYRVFDPESMTWSDGPDLPASATPVGTNGGGLAVSKRGLVVVTGTQVWTLEGESSAATWVRGMELPSALSPSGGMVAADLQTSRLYLVAGGGTRRLSAVDLDDPEFYGTALLPDAVSIRGQRSFVADVDGERIFAVMRGHDSNQMFTITIEELDRLLDEK